MNEKDETIQNMSKEIEKISLKLCEAKEALFDAQRMNTQGSNEWIKTS